MSELPFYYQLLIWSVPVIFAITLHEVGHGWAALKLGDSTAKDRGRLTLNPFRHIDPVGSIVVPLLMFFSSGFIFGWAKPVPVDWSQLRNQRRDMVLVALAGPAANLLMICFWLCIARLFIASGEQGNLFALIVTMMAWAGVVINALVMILNLFPLPPLDGSRVMFTLLPARLARSYAKLEPYGLIILAVLLIAGVFGKLILPMVSGLESFLYGFID